MFSIVDEKSLSPKERFYLAYGHSMQWVFDAFQSDVMGVRYRVRSGVYTDMNIKRCPTCNQAWEIVGELIHYDIAYGIYKEWKECPNCESA